MCWTRAGHCHKYLMCWTWAGCCHMYIMCWTRAGHCHIYLTRWTAAHHCHMHLMCWTRADCGVQVPRWRRTGGPAGWLPWGWRCYVQTWRWTPCWCSPAGGCGPAGIAVSSTGTPVLLSPSLMSLPGEKKASLQVMPIQRMAIFNNNNNTRRKLMLKIIQQNNLRTKRRRTPLKWHWSPIIAKKLVVSKLRLLNKFLNWKYSTSKSLHLKPIFILKGLSH